MAQVPKQIQNDLIIVGEKIGNGAFGDVYRAKFKNREIAIKFENLKAKTLYLPNEVAVNIQNYMFISHHHLYTTHII